MPQIKNSKLYKLISSQSITSLNVYVIPHQLNKIVYCTTFLTTDTLAKMVSCVFCFFSLATALNKYKIMGNINKNGSYIFGSLRKYLFKICFIARYSYKKQFNQQHSKHRFLWYINMHLTSKKYIDSFINRLER